MSPLSKPAPDHVNTRMCLHWAAWASKFGPYNYKCEPAGGVGGVKVRLWSVGNNHCSPSSICGDISEWSRQPEIVLNAQFPLSYKLLEVPVLLFFSVDPLLYRLSLPGVLALPLLIFPSFSSNSPFLFCSVSFRDPSLALTLPIIFPGDPRGLCTELTCHESFGHRLVSIPPLPLCLALAVAPPLPSLFSFVVHFLYYLLLRLSFLWRTRAQAQCGHNDDMTAAFR